MLLLEDLPISFWLKIGVGLWVLGTYRITKIIKS